jgi:peptide/nickel transport system ATP-binding protein
MTLLETINLKTYFPTKDGLVRAVDDVNLSIEEREKLGLIGETGCGKTVLGLSIIRLLQSSARIEGQILYRGQDLLKLSDEEMRLKRGKEIAMILQNPTTSLNPVLKIGDQIAEAIRLHQGLDKKDAKLKAVEILEAVKISEASKRADQYPHELSGGMKERVMIAIGLACNPSFIIADEPSKGLDVATKLQIVDLLKRVTMEKSMMIITHDLGVASMICDKIAVMYAGEIFEEAPAEAILTSPAHPYTQGFINSLPGRGLRPIPGASPSLIDFPNGCRFHPRCNRAFADCRKSHPEVVRLENGHFVRCLLYT